MLPWFGLFPVRSPLLGKSRLISLPPGTEMFQFPGLAPLRVTDLAAGRVAPFGHPEITAYVQLPQAFRSLSRPSSPLDAKASTVCLIAFDLDLLTKRTSGSGLRTECFHFRLSFQAKIQSVLIPNDLDAGLLGGVCIGSSGPTIVKERTHRTEDSGLRTEW